MSANTVTFLSSSTRAAGFDNLGQQLWAVDERGVAVTNSYDSLGRLKGSAYIPYAAESMPADVTDLPANCTPASCDEDQIYGGFTGQAISFDAYDPNGTTNARGSVRGERGWLRPDRSRSARPAGQGRSNLLSMTDWAGDKSYEYDALNRCTYVKEDHSSTFGFHYAITNAYDLVGSRITNNYVIAATGANRWHQNVSLFDGLGRIRTNVVSLSSLASPIAATYAYNPNGKLATNSVAYGSIAIHTNIYSYDRENRLTGITNLPMKCDRLSLVHAYNDAQQITSIGEAWGSSTNVQTYAYDGRDQLLSEYQYSSTPSLRFTKSYAYDNAQNRTGSVANAWGTNTPSSYYIQPANKLEAIADVAGGMSLADKLANGCNPCKEDTDDDEVSDAQEVAQNTCPWLPDSDGDGITDNADAQPLRPNGAVWHGADSATPGQGWWQTSTSKPATSLRTSANHKYYYDVAGNLATSIVNGVTTVFRYNAQNKLSRIEGNGFTYDFFYDSQNRRIAIRRNAGAYRYDIHDGNICIASVVNGTMDKFFVRGAGIAEGTGDVIAEIDSAGTPHFYVANHRGDTLQVLNSSGAAELDLRFDAFGNPASSIQHQGSFSPRYTFSTKEYLEDAGLYLYAYRVYDPVAGRWTQRDPIDYQDSVNLYQFCGNNPINCTDRDGRWITLVILVVAIVVIGTTISSSTGKTVNTIADNTEVAVNNLDVEHFANTQKARIGTAEACVTMGEVITTTADAALGVASSSEKVIEGAGRGTMVNNSNYNQNIRPRAGVGGYQCTVPQQGNKYVSNSAGDAMASLSMQSMAAKAAPKTAVTAARGASEISAEVGGKLAEAIAHSTGEHEQ